jgi:uncharacterized delta-60 repeat protein
MMKNLFFCLLFIGLFFSTYISAQPELDTTFASTGKKLIQFTSSGYARDIVVQPDNKLVLVGECRDINFGVVPFCLIRLSENGDFDSTFGQTISGVVFTRIPGTISPFAGQGIALQNDGKIVVTGSPISGVTIIRYNSDGSLDSSFGTNGMLQTTVNGNDLANKLVIQPDGKIVVVGYSGSSSNYKQFVARYLPNGMRDNLFGTSGVVTINIPGNLTVGFSIALQPDGKILTGGASSGAFLLTRLNRDGSLDTTFDGDGFKSVLTATNIIPERGNFVSVAVQTDGRILALGDTNILYSFNSDGSLDTNFDDDGSRTALDGTSDSYDLVVTPAGKITVVGNPTIASSYPNINYRAARYLPNGSPDPNFSMDGFLDIDLSGVDGATAVALDAQARIVIGGRSAFGTIFNAPWANSLFSATRLSAQPTQNVGFSGRVLNSNGTPVFNAFITLQNGEEIIANARTNPFGYFRFRNVQTNQTYTLSTRAKSLNFPDRSVLVDDEINNYTIYGDDLPILIQRR